MGLLQFFINSKPILKPYLTPLFRTADVFGPGYDTSCAGKQPPIFRRIPILEGSDLQKTLIFFMEIIAMNCLNPFQNAFRRPCGPCTRAFNLYCDAAGEFSIFNKEVFGMGGLCYDLNFA